MNLTMRQLRRLNEITKKRAAEIFGVSHDTITRWESGETYPNAIQILKICEHYKCRFEDIKWTSQN